MDAGPKCAPPIDEPPPQWAGTYPKTLPRLSNDDWTARAKMLAARNPDVDTFFVDQIGGAVRGFTTKKTPYTSQDASQRFVSGRSIALPDLQPLLVDLRCANPDVAHFEPTEAHLSRAADLAFVIAFERSPSPTDEMIRNEPLPAPLDDDTLAGKWKLGAEVARVHHVTVHIPAPPFHGCATGHPCDPVGPRDEDVEKRVPVGTVAIAKKYLQVKVTRASYVRAAGIELRLIARVEVRWDELRNEVLTPRFGASLEPQITGNFQEVFDAVTGNAFNPYAP